jgi:hypothetical protein
VPGTRIEDLACPRLPIELRALNALGGPAARRWVRLEEEELLEAARRRSGLSDFGDPSFRIPLRVLLGALVREAGLSAFGRFGTRQLLLQLLESRLRLESLIRLHPEILDERIERPIIIAGLPRTGTSHLFTLLSRNPGLRWLPYWEGLEPIPDPAETRARDGRDPRMARCDRALAYLHRVMPLFSAMHEIETEAPHEEIQLLAMQFSTQLFEASYHVPSYGEWYRTTDQTPAYAYLKRVLQALQWLRRGRRWLLKSPQHLENLGPLARTFPDACFVQTHRDPVRITASLCTMIAYGARMQHRRPDPRAIGRHWAKRVEDMLRASVRDRSLLPAAQVMDLRFDEFMKDNLAAVERVFAFAGEPFAGAVADAVRAHLDANPKGKHGTIDYRLDDLGLDGAERRAALRFYSERFGVPSEDDGHPAPLG